VEKKGELGWLTSNAVNKGTDFEMGRHNAAKKGLRSSARALWPALLSASPAKLNRDFHPPTNHLAVAEEESEVILLPQSSFL